MIKKYRKKPVVVEALEFTGAHDFTERLQSFTDGASRKWVHKCEDDADIFELSPTHYYINNNIPRTDDGDVDEDAMDAKYIANKGDFIIKGLNGEFYPCKPDVFKKTYEEVES